MGKIERVPAAGEVVVIPRLARQQPVIGEVVDPAKVQSWAEVIAFGGAIVDDVENDFDSGIVQAGGRGSEGIQRGRPGRTGLGGGKPGGVIAPPGSPTPPPCGRCGGA